MRTSALLSVFVLALFAAGCAPMPSAKGSILHSGPVPEMLPDKNSAVVTFYRPKAFVGGGASFYIQENGENIGGLRNGTYFSVRTTPGRHTYTAETSVADKDAITITAKSNTTSYIEATVSMGVWMGEPHLKEVSDATAKPEIQKLKYIELKPVGQPGQGSAYGL